MQFHSDIRSDKISKLKKDTVGIEDISCLLDEDEEIELNMKDISVKQVDLNL